MHITRTKWCDFVVWSVKDLAIVRVEYDHDFFNEKIYSKLKPFYFLAIAPEIVEQTHKRKKDFEDWLDFPMYEI